VSSLKLLKHHIRLRHKFEFDRVVCNQEGCFRTFESKRSVYQHILKCHKNLIDIVETRKTSVIDDSNISSGNDISLGSDIEIERNDEDLGDTNSVELVDGAELLFILKLYNKQNLTRSDIDDIIHNTIELKNDDNSFKNLRTEFQLMKTLTEKGIFMKPESIVLSYKQKPSLKNGEYICSQIPICAQYFNLKETIKIIFKCPKNLELAVSYMQTVSKDLTDIKDSALYKKAD
jgi:hypothetical protein